ncbi:MAG: rRNA pseudouridine synthase [Acidobacteria bacterium]|nr:rRNA pseudouridine synthase [Acidobacteriota bacterium]
MKEEKDSRKSNSEKIRINRFLARAGLASRREAEILIEEGRVYLTGERVDSFAVMVDPYKDFVEVDGERVKLPKRYSYFLFYKPKEVVSTMEDPEGRACIKKFIPKDTKGLFPVGRLDYHSEGLLLLTNDGELSARLLHPRYKVVKTYELKVKGSPSQESLNKLRRGIFLEGKKTLPVEIKKIFRRETSHTWLEVKMKEGRKNQLREMFFRIEHPVIKLKRTAIGPIKIGKMKSGEIRELKKEEVEELYKSCGLDF